MKPNQFQHHLIEVKIKVEFEDFTDTSNFIRANNDLHMNCNNYYYVHLFIVEDLVLVDNNLTWILDLQEINWSFQEDLKKINKDWTDHDVHYFDQS